MKLLHKFLACSMVLSVGIFSGCSDDDDNGGTSPTTSQFDMLSDYADVEFSGWTASWIKDVNYTHDNLADLFVIDLRSPADYGLGHIAGAVNVTLTDMLMTVATQNTADDEVAVVCYTGQTASFATMALRMAGHDAYSVKFGMSAWHDSYNGSWMNNVDSDYSPQMVHDASAALPQNDFPDIDTDGVDAQTILADRVQAVLEEGFGANSVNAEDVFTYPEDYMVFNYWSQADYETLGHIPGAYQLSPGSVTSDVSLSALSPTGTNVIYCWTGQTSALTTFYLNVMGYDALSLEFGANGMMYDQIAGHQWPAAGVGANFPVVTD